MELAALISEMTAALEEELVEIRSSERQQRIQVFGGREVGRSGPDWVYTFALHYPAALPDEVSLRIELPARETYTGQLVSSTSFEATISAGVRLPAPLTGATLILDASFILEELIQRLVGMEEGGAELALALFGLRKPAHASPPGGPALPDEEANEFQLAAIEAVVARDVTYVWGPPGTGKTTTLAFIAEALVRRGLRVLALASTNVAVDNSVVQIGRRLAGSASVVRLGTPQLPALRESTPAAPTQQRMLEDSAAFLPRQVADGVGFAAEMSAVTVLPSKRFQDPEQEAQRLRTLRAASVVGATLSRVVLAPELALPGFDAVLIDEASAASLPAVFYAAGLARQKVAALGDPKQLPPVATSNGPLARRWLQRDIFAQATLEDDDSRAVLLREQYRMHPGISRLANQLVYGGRLIDAVRNSHSSGGARLIDTGPDNPRCMRTEGSRQNELHAELAVSLAKGLLGDFQGSVAIITPYRAQARLIWRRLRDLHLERQVDVGTVHRFQGLEREAIIFDTVESEPEWPAPFVSGGYGSEAMRLLNVAITRARTELLIMANVDYLWRKLRRGSILLELLRLLLEDGGN